MSVEPLLQSGKTRNLLKGKASILALLFGSFGLCTLYFVATDQLSAQYSRAVDLEESTSIPLSLVPRSDVNGLRTVDDPSRAMAVLADLLASRHPKIQTLSAASVPIASSTMTALKV
jgi:hypothetical protein